MKREIQAFLNEVEAAREIDHENILRVVYVETDPDDLPPTWCLSLLKVARSRTG